MTAVRETFFARVETVLNTIAGHSVLRNPRHEAYEDSDLPLYVLWDGGHQTQEDMTGADQFTLNFDIEIYALAGSDNAGTALNASYAAATNALRADFADGSSGTLGGLARQFRERGLTDPDFVRPEGRKEAVVATLECFADIWTEELDVEQLAP